MKKEPEMAGNVVILVAHKRQFFWYVSEKELWIMNLLKLDNAFRIKSGLQKIATTEAEDERRGFELLNEENISDFQEVIKSYQVSYKELEEYYDVYSELYLDNEEFEVNPSFYLNFDDRVFYSFFLEPGSYEHYIPENWAGIFRTNPNEFVPKEAKV